MTAYVGGKGGVIGKQIANVITELNHDNLPVWDVTCGMCGVLRHIRAPKRYASDIHSDLITMWQKLQRNWLPPINVSFEEYMELKNNPYADPALRTYVGFAFGYCGVFMGSFKPRFQIHHDVDPATGLSLTGVRAFRGVQNALNSLRDVRFLSGSYDEMTDQIPELRQHQPMCIYADPPYKHSVKKIGSRTTTSFDFDKFWNWVRNMSAQHLVIVSEREAPPDFIKIWSKPRTLRMNNRFANRTKTKMDECLFVCGH